MTEEKKTPAEAGRMGGLKGGRSRSQRKIWSNRRIALKRTERFAKGVRGPKPREWSNETVTAVRKDFLEGQTFDAIMKKHGIPSRWYVRRMVRPVMIEISNELDKDN